MAKDCYKKKNDEQVRSARNDDDSSQEDNEVSLTARNEVANRCLIKDKEELWIGDSGASGHMVNSDKNMFDCKEIDEEVEVANDDFMRATKRGKLAVYALNRAGQRKRFVLEDVQYIPTLGRYNLFSVTRAITRGFKISNEGETIILSKGSNEIQFDHIIRTKTGFVGATSLDRTTPKDVTSRDKALRTEDVNVFHRKMGHMNEAMTRKVAKNHGVELTGKFKVCEACAEAKAKKKDIRKGESVKKDWKPGEKLWMDVSSIKQQSYAGSKFWLLIVDDRTDYCWSYFMKKKCEVGENLLSLMNELKAKGIETTKIRCDNAGENESAERLLKKNKFNVKFEYTAPDTPEQNGKVERKFAALYGRV